MVSLRKPFRSGAPGSKILVTTRNASVSSIMRSVPDHILERLSDEDCWELFRQHAFDIHSAVDPRVEAIGRAIADKCGGLPLAASTVGGLLRFKHDISEWGEILNSRMWLLADNSSILPALRLSYHHLPVNLKRCFAYCSIFPKDYEFRENELVLLWMAEGFVPQLKGVGMEDLGRKYFHDLVSRSFFQRQKPDKSVFVMHILVHDLAEYVSEGICFRWEDLSKNGAQCKLPKDARHLSYNRDYYEPFTKFEGFKDAESLRTLLPLDGGRSFSYLPEKFLTELLPELNLVRVLSLKSYQINHLPESIGRLKHLRYLDLSHTPIRRLPESTGNLFNLQTLLLVGCKSLTELSFDIENLINLQHFDASQSGLKKMPAGIGKLVNLQRLSSFAVGQRGPGIRELRNLLQLRGGLCISGLHYVLDVREVVEASFENKQHLSVLELEWSVEANVFVNKILAEQLLGIILSATRLKELKIRNYPGERLPIRQYQFLETLVLSNMLNLAEWPLLEEDGLFCCLRQLKIQDCPKLKNITHSFPALEKLNIKCCPELVTIQRSTSTGPLAKKFAFFPRLCEIFVEHCPKLTGLPSFMPSLQMLKLSRCLELTKLSTSEGEEIFPELLKLSIRNCPKIRRLPAQLPSLVQLDISGCFQLLALPRCPLISELRLEQCGQMLLRKAGCLHSLTSLYICEIQGLRCLPDCLLKQLTALKDLEVRSCDMLKTCFSDVSSQHLVSLQRLLIFSCSNLEELPQQLHGLTALNKLEIWSCPPLQFSREIRSPFTLQDLWISTEADSFPAGMMQNNSLEKISIWNSHSLASFPSCKLPSTLKALSIMSCSKLEQIPRKMMQHNNTLESLLIDSCESLNSFTVTGAANLKELKIIGCGSLKTVPGDIHLLGSLHSLTIISCPLLVSFPDGGLPRNLRKIHVSKCYELKSLPLHNVAFLQDLTVRKCPNLTRFPGDTLPSKLEHLVVETSGNLNNILEWGINKLTSLKNLTIADGCGGELLFTERTLPASLRALSIKNLPKLESLGRALEHLHCLRYLRVIRCRNLSALPEELLPGNLCFLQIVDCPKVKQQYQVKKNSGLDQYSLVSCLTLDDDF